MSQVNSRLIRRSGLSAKALLSLSLSPGSLSHSRVVSMVRRFPLTFFGPSSSVPRHREISLKRRMVERESWNPMAQFRINLVPGASYVVDFVRDSQGWQNLTASRYQKKESSPPHMPTQKFAYSKKLSLILNVKNMRN